MQDVKNETNSNVYIEKHLSDTFSVQYGLEQGNALSLLNTQLGRSRNTRYD
jgi:hypothetical protein